MRKNLFIAAAVSALGTLCISLMQEKSGNSHAVTTALVAPSSEQIDIDFNADFINGLIAPSIDLGERDAVLDAIFTARPDGLNVYPSEGYYYFKFNNAGERIKGNFRFDIQQRDQGTFSFIYYKELANVSAEKTKDNYHVLGQEGDGVEFVKKSDFLYEIRYKDFTIPVRIYDAELELATPKNIGPEEEYVGPAYDESGIRFHLIFDYGSNNFLYVLNDMFGHPESYSALDDDNVILVGTRSKFAYFNDKGNDRYVLIGVSGHNVENNNYYDGPFDQLPDSFVDGDHLKNLIEKFEPRAVGKIGPYGSFLEEEGVRYAISPYMEYFNPDQLLKYIDCQDVNSDRTVLNTCLATIPT